MYQKSKEYWKKKAQEENAMVENEKQAEKEIEYNQVGWDRRIKESSWLLKGVARIDDQTMGNMVEKVVKDKSKDFEMFVTKTTTNVAKSSGVKKEATWKEYIKSFVYPSKESLDRKMNDGRYVDQKLRLKEKYADKMVERDARRNRRNFLREGAKHIRVLQQIGVVFKRSRHPSHHVSAMELPDYEPPTYAEEKEIEEYCAANLRNFAEDICVPAPMEVLRTNAEVLAEEKERRTWKVSSRYHLHLGAGKLFPLKSHPVTTTALFEHPHFVTYEEDTLLPDREAERKVKEQEDLKFAKENLPIYKIKKSKLNMSRQQYRARRPDSAPAGFLFPWQGSGSVSVHTRNSGHALTHAHRPRARLNQQFKYGQKQFHDSVDSLPARQQLKTPLDASSSVEDDDYSAAPSELTEDTTQMHRVDYKLTDDPASLFYLPPEKQKASAVAGAFGGTGFGFGKGSSVLSLRRPGGYKSSSVVPVNAFDAPPAAGAPASGRGAVTVSTSLRPFTAGATPTAAAAAAGGGSVVVGRTQSASHGNRSVVSGRNTNYPETGSLMGNSLSWAGGAAGGIAMTGDYYTVDGGQSMSFMEGEDSRVLQQQSQLGWQSDDAVRSNYLSVQSTNPGIMVPVKMQRYRKMRKIDTRRVKGGFHLISRESKDRKLDDRKKFVKQRLKEINEGLL